MHKKIVMVTGWPTPNGVKLNIICRGSSWNIGIPLKYNVQHRRTGRVSFRAAEFSCPNIFCHCLHENQVDLPEYYLIFLPKNGYLKISRGATAPLSPTGRTPMMCKLLKWPDVWVNNIGILWNSRLTTEIDWFVLIIHMYAIQSFTVTWNIVPLFVKNVPLTCHDILCTALPNYSFIARPSSEDTSKNNNTVMTNFLNFSPVIQLANFPA